MGYLNKSVYYNGIEPIFNNGNKSFIIVLSSVDLSNADSISSNILASSAIIKGGIKSDPVSYDSDAKTITNVFDWAGASKTFSIKSIAYNYTKDVISDGAGSGQTGCKWNDAGGKASYFAVIDVSAASDGNTVDITPFTDASDIKFLNSTGAGLIGKENVLITGNISGSGVTIQENNNFLFGAVSISFSETSTN